MCHDEFGLCVQNKLTLLGAQLGRPMSSLKQKENLHFDLLLFLCFNSHYETLNANLLDSQMLIE